MTDRLYTRPWGSGCWQPIRGESGGASRSVRADMRDDPETTHLVHLSFVRPLTVVIRLHLAGGRLPPAAASESPVRDVKSVDFLRTRPAGPSCRPHSFLFFLSADFLAVTGTKRWPRYVLAWAFTNCLASASTVQMATGDQCSAVRAVAVVSGLGRGTGAVCNLAGPRSINPKILLVRSAEDTAAVPKAPHAEIDYVCQAYSCGRNAGVEPRYLGCPGHGRNPEPNAAVPSTVVGDKSPVSAPEFTGVTAWVNSKPLKFADQKEGSRRPLLDQRLHQLHSQLSATIEPGRKGTRTTEIWSSSASIPRNSTPRKTSTRSKPRRKRTT